jgi:hypothetical protein
MLNSNSNTTTPKYNNDGNKFTYINEPWGQHEGGGYTPSCQPQGWIAILGFEHGSIPYECEDHGFATIQTCNEVGPWKSHSLLSLR